MELRGGDCWQKGTQGVHLEYTKTTWPFCVNQMHTLCAFLTAISSLQIYATRILGWPPLSEEEPWPGPAVCVVLCK